MCDCVNSKLSSLAFSEHTSNASKAEDLVNIKLHSFLGQAQQVSSNDPHLAKVLRTGSYNSIIRRLNSNQISRSTSIKKYAPINSTKIVYDLTLKSSGAPKNEKHLLVLLDKNSNQNFLSLAEDFGSKGLKITWNIGLINESIILTTTPNTDPPPALAPCNQQGLSFKGCVKCAWDDLGSDAIGTLAQLSNPFGCYAACMIHCMMIVTNNPNILHEIQTAITQNGNIYNPQGIAHSQVGMVSSHRRF
jgi:hypothetical protein